MGLLHLLILLTFAKLQDSAENSSAWQWALSFAGVTFLFVFFNGDLMSAAITAAFWGLYSWAYFALLRRLVDSLVLWLLVYIGGVILPWLLLAQLLLSASAQ